MSTLSSASALPLSTARPQSPARRVALGAALLGAACLLGLLEATLPPLAFVPWLRLGLANVAVVIALAVDGARTAAWVSGLRLLIVALMTGALGGPTFALSLAGALGSFLVMCALSRFNDRFSPVGWSAAGSAAHVLAQFVAAAVLLGTPAVLRLAPVSMLLALALGAAIGSLACATVSRLSHA